MTGHRSLVFFFTLLVSSLSLAAEITLAQAMKKAKLDLSDFTATSEYSNSKCTLDVKEKMAKLAIFSMGTTNTPEDKIFASALRSEGTQIICKHLAEMHYSVRRAISDDNIQDLEIHGGANGNKVLRSVAEGVSDSVTKLDRDLDALFDKFESNAKNDSQKANVESLKGLSNKYLMASLQGSVVKLKTVASTESIALERNLVKSKPAAQAALANTYTGASGEGQR